MELRCRCGNFILEWDSQLKPIVARVCSCNYCTMNKCEYVSDPESVVRFEIADESLHNIITHGHGTAKFHECKNCGVIAAISRIDNWQYCVLNAKTLGLKGYRIDPVHKDYAGESIEERLARRKMNWSRLASGT